MKDNLSDIVNDLAKKKNQQNKDIATNNIIASLNNKQEQVDEQISNVVDSSPVAVKAFVEPRATIDELYAMVGGDTSGKKTKSLVPNPTLDTLETPDEGVKYGAYRSDAMSPATQNQNAATITQNPMDIHIGGRVPMGSKINAVYPGEKDTFFLKQKFEPVKPYPFTYPNGRTMTIDTANLNKAAWLYFGSMEPTRPIDWYGYYKIPNVVEEGGAHAFARGVVNFVPQLAIRSAGFVNTVALDAAEGISRLFGDNVMGDYYKSARKIGYKVTEDLANDWTWQYGPKGVGDTYANKFWHVGGQIVPMAALSFMGGMAALPFFNAAEAADAALYVRQAMEDKGMSTLSSIGMTTATGLGVFAIGMLPEMVDTLFAAVARPAQGLIKMAKESPEVLKRMYKARNIMTAVTEGLISEPGQDIFTSVMAGERPEWEDALYTAFWSLLASSVTLSVDRGDPAKAILKNVENFKKYLDTHQEFMDLIVQGSNGAITRENIDLILDMLSDPKQTEDLLNYLKEGMIGNFDKLTKEQKQQLIEKVKNLDPDSDLETEFRRLDENIDKMLADSEQDGRTPLTPEQKQLAKLMLRAVAAQQLTNFNILPSQMKIPKNIFGGYKRAVGAVEGSTTKSGVITVNNDLVSSYAPVGKVAPAQTGSVNENLNTSAKVRNEYAEAGVVSEQSGGFAGLSHEFWHWVEQQTGLPNVGEFMQGIKDLAEQIVPGITKGKEGVELSEAYAYAIGFAGEKAKTALGLTGKTADYIDFMNLAWNAEDIAKGVETGLRNYMDSYRKVLETNKGLVDDLIKGYGTEKLHGAVNNFIETGNPNSLKFDDMRALNAALSSVVDTETGDKLGKIFDSQSKAQSFMERYAQEYDKLLETDKGLAKATKQQLIQQRDAANKASGVTKELTPSNSKEEGFADKAVEIVSQDEPKEEVKQRTRKNGQPYDVDSIIAGRYDGDPNTVIGYLQNAAQWSKGEGMRFKDIKTRRVSYTINPDGSPNIKLEPSYGSDAKGNRLDHYAAYVLLARNKLSQMYKKNMLTEEHMSKIKDAEMFSAAANVQEANIDIVLDRLSEKVANGTNTVDEKDLYTTIANYNRDMSNIYVDFGPYTPVDTARVALSSTEQLIEDLVALSQSSNDKTVLTLINNPNIAGEEIYRSILPQDVTENVNIDVSTKLTFNKANRSVERITKNRSLLEILGDYTDFLRDYIDYKEFEYDLVHEKQEKTSKAERRAIGVLKSKKTSKAQKEIAAKTLGSIAESKYPIEAFFKPDYNTEYSSDYVSDENVSSAEQEGGQGAQNVISARNKLSRYLNPIRRFLNRDIFHTKTPLEQLGMSLEEAEKEIRSGGEVPFDFRTGELAEQAKQSVNSDYIKRNINSDDIRVSENTRRSMLAKMLELVPSVGEETNRAKQLNVLYAISTAKEMANSLFQEYIDAEESYNYNPTMNVEAFESGKKFSETPRYKEKLKEQLDKGYTEQVPASSINVSDEIAFAYGNNFVRGVVSYKYKTPAGATGFIVLEDVDINSWREKDFSAIKKFPKQIIVSEMVLDTYGFLKKPLGVANPARMLELLSLYDDISQASGHKNFTRVAEDSVSKAIEDRQYYEIEQKQKLVEEEMVEGDKESDEEYYSAAGKTPEIDPGVFPLLEDNPVGLSDQEFRDLFGESSLDFIEDIENGASIPETRLAFYESVTNKDNDNFKKKFSDYGDGLLKGIRALRDGLSERNFGKIGKIALMGAWQTGLDRKLRAIFGENAEKMFNFTLTSSKAQELSEGRRHAFDKALIEKVFNGSRKNYESWLVKTPTEEFDATLANGQTVQVTRGEIISMYMAQYAVENKMIDTFNYTNPEERMRMFYGDSFDELISHLTPTDKKFAEAAVMAIGDARGTDTLLAQYWTPCVNASDYGKKGWKSRIKNTPDTSIYIMSQEPLAATSAFESVLSIIGSRSLQESGFTDKLNKLRLALVFEDLDLSKFKAMTTEDMAMYEEIKKESAALKQEIEDKIGPTMTRWLIDNIDVDLRFNPLVKDMSKNPVLGAFAKATRSVAASLLMLSPKQGYVNLGNYDMFNGLSNSSSLKFYTVDRANAWMNFRDAWNLMLTFPEWKRRLEQSGLTEQMRRVADMNEESFMKDIQQALYKNQKDGYANFVGAINTLGKISSKYGLATNVVPDLVGIALGTYAVWDDVLARNNGNIQKAQNEIVTHVLNRVSSSNYMTRSAATKMLDKMGLGAFEMFKGDQLQKIGTLSEAVLTLLNSKDTTARKKAWKDITAVAYATARYVAIQAGWIAAISKIVGGEELSDSEKEYLYEATLREALTQIADTTQLGSFVTSILTGILEGRDMSPSILPISGIQRATTAIKKGNFFKAGAEVGAFVGATPIAPGLVRLIDGISRMASEDEKEAKVGLRMALGRSEATAQNMEGLTRSPKTGKLQDKKVRKEKDDK